MVTRSELDNLRKEIADIRAKLEEPYQEPVGPRIEDAFTIQEEQFREAQRGAEAQGLILQETPWGYETRIPGHRYTTAEERHLESGEPLRLRIEDLPFEYFPPFPKAWDEETRRSIREEAMEDYPWSDWGEFLVNTTPISTPGDIYGAFKQRRVGDEYAGTTSPLWPVVFANRRGYVIPHEMAHAAMMRQYPEENLDAYLHGTLTRSPFVETASNRFESEYRDWLNAIPEEEWGVDRQWAAAMEEFRGFNPTETYAEMAERPWLIPPELEHWYPQFDLRSRGPTAREGYQGPGPTRINPITPLMPWQWGEPMRARAGGQASTSNPISEAIRKFVSRW